jgi:hypothetical protein
MASNDAVGLASGVERHCGGEVAFSVVCEASPFAVFVQILPGTRKQSGTLRIRRLIALAQHWGVC